MWRCPTRITAYSRCRLIPIITWITLRSWCHHHRWTNNRLFISNKFLIDRIICTGKWCRAMGEAQEQLIYKRLHSAEEPITEWSPNQTYHISLPTSLHGSLIRNKMSLKVLEVPFLQKAQCNQMLVLAPKPRIIKGQWCSISIGTPTIPQTISSSPRLFQYRMLTIRWCFHNKRVQGSIRESMWERSLNNSMTTIITNSIIKNNRLLVIPNRTTHRH